MTLQFFHDIIEALPAFDEIPQMGGVPKGAVWGLWDKNGERDELGSLNLLTPKTVANAGQEIKLGIRVSLDLPLDKPRVPVFERQEMKHTIRDNTSFSSSQSFDDTILFNTQAGSQWDGLRHVIHEDTGMLYNGVRKAEIMGPQASNVLGIHKWHDKGCVAGRGVLIDFVQYAERHGIKYEASAYHPITCADLDRAAKEQTVEFRAGDILLIRMGFLKWYNECVDTTERDAWFKDPNKASVGVDPNPETIAWVWNHHFAAVAGDSLAWEAMPLPSGRPSFHQYLLPLWGMPIGELWNLEGLAQTCQDLGRYSFFLTSSPLNVPGGVASPPNAIAIF